MGLKTTLFAILMVIVIGWRNKKIADLEGKTPVYSIKDIKNLYGDAFKHLKDLFKKKNRQ